MQSTRLTFRGTFIKIRVLGVGLFCGPTASVQLTISVGENTAYVFDLF